MVKIRSLGRLRPWGGAAVNCIILYVPSKGLEVVDILSVSPRAYHVAASHTCIRESSLAKKLENSVRLFCNNKGKAIKSLKRLR